MRSHTRFLAISTLLLGAIALSACAPASASTQAPAATTAPAMSAMDASKATSAADLGGLDGLVAAAKAEGKLTVITLPRNWCNYGELMDNFTSKYGIAITDLNPDGGSNDEVEAIKANKDNKGPQAPDVIDVGLAYGPLVVSDSLVSNYKVATWDTIPDSQKDSAGYWFGDYYGVMTLKVNADVVKNIPQDYADLLKPEYKGQVALYGDPRASNQAAQSVYAAGLGTGGSLDNVMPGLDFFKKLNAAGNLVPVISDDGSFAKGETPITFAWDYLALTSRDTLNGNPKVQVVVPTSAVLGGFYVQGISAYAPHPAAARLWEEYLYSDEGQLGMLKGYCHPIRFQDMTTRKVIPADLSAKLPPPEAYAKAVFPSIDQLNNVRQAVKDNWDKTVGVDYKK